ncbi:hypothetical protein [Glycomyces buryatensis]|uniref:Uncharacterized protein n=1 Tax=Glycomyces buryatensis TaxID=2570927 RepID=A0A4S8QES7_9ACTN|nr:hypothetical protein [Glycomyces buryatensis]THV41415.1 hypothetical protein FAB82_11485 [Glycomyces buryatensis]
MARAYSIDEIEEIGTDVLPNLANAYWDLAQGAQTAGKARDSMFQEATVTSNVGPGSGGGPVEPAGASAVGRAWRTIYERLETALSESATNLENLGTAMEQTAESMRTAEEDTEVELTELLTELDDNY